MEVIATFMEKHPFIGLGLILLTRVCAESILNVEAISGEEINLRANSLFLSE